MEDVLTSALWLSVLFIVPGVAYFGRPNVPVGTWGFVRAGEDVVGGGPYREARVARTTEGDAPGIVKLAAFSSFFLGQMIVTTPAALLAFLAPEEPILMVLAFSAPTGAMVAWKIFGAGNLLLLNRADAAVRARSAATWATNHNLVLLVALAACAAYHFVRADGPRVFAAVPCGVYACISLAHATLLRRAADAVDARNAATAAEPASLAPVLA